MATDKQQNTDAMQSQLVKKQYTAKFENAAAKLTPNPQGNKDIQYVSVREDTSFPFIMADELIACNTKFMQCFV